MKKIIIGTKHLKMAMVETLNEMGFQPKGNYTTKHLVESDFGFSIQKTQGKLNYSTKKLSVCKTDTDWSYFNLPTDWDAVIDYAKMLMIDSKYSIGETVVMSDDLKGYSTRSSTFINLGFKNTQRNDYFQNGTLGVIFGIELDEHEKTLMYALRDKNGNETLVGEKGLSDMDNYKVKITLNDAGCDLTITPTGIIWSFINKPFPLSFEQLQTLYGVSSGYNALRVNIDGYNFSHLDLSTLVNIKNEMNFLYQMKPL